MKLRAAVLGCGAIGTGQGTPHPDVGVITHAGAYAACADTELVAVCDTDSQRAAEHAARWGVPAYSDAARMLEEQSPEIVSVATPDATHAAELERCLRADGVRGVLAEKPLALDVDDRAHARRPSRGPATWSSPSTTRAATRRRCGACSGDLGVGELQHVSGVYVKGLAHNGTHWLDLLRMLAGEPVVARGWDRLGEGGPDPTLDAELTLRLGRGGAARRARHGAIHRVRDGADGHAGTCADLRGRARRRALRGGRGSTPSGLSGPAARRAGDRRPARRHAARRRRPRALRPRGRRTGVHRRRRGGRAWPSRRRYAVPSSDVHGRHRARPARRARPSARARFPARRRSARASGAPSRR